MITSSLLTFFLFSTANIVPLNEGAILDEYLFSSHNVRVIAEVLSARIIRAATIKVTHAMASEKRLREELDAKIAELHQFDRMVAKELQQAVRNYSVMKGSMGKGNRSDRADNRSHFEEEMADGSKAANDFYLRHLHRRKVKYFIQGDKRPAGKANESSDKVGENFQGIISEKVTKIKTAVTATSLLSEDSKLMAFIEGEDPFSPPLDDAHPGLLHCRNDSSGEKKDTRENIQESEDAIITETSLVLSQPADMARSSFHLDEERDVADLRVSEEVTASIICTPPSYPKSTFHFASPTRKILGLNIIDIPQ